MGPAPRGGAYTYDWIENLLGLGMHSVDQVLPEYQHAQIGDAISLGSNRMLVERVDPQHVLAWRSEDGNWVWTFVIENRAGWTRLISRNRFRLPTLIARLAMLPMEPGSLLMERKMLLGSSSVGQHRRRREPLQPGCSPELEASAAMSAKQCAPRVRPPLLRERSGLQRPELLLRDRAGIEQRLGLRDLVGGPPPPAVSRT